MNFCRRKPISIFALFFLSLSLSACAARHSANDYKVTATIWQASSAEVAALYLQGFNVAKDALDKELMKSGKRKPLAITTDIDQTVLDTSGYTAWQLKTGLEYPDGWAEFVHRESSPATPGSVEFLKYADQEGIAIFYVTNRKEEFRQSTIGNLKKHGFPQVDDKHLFLRTKEKGKTEYYAEIAKNHEIILMLGDNLADFDESFDEGTNADRNARVLRMQDTFGRKHIVFPNAMYGGWERAHLDYKDVTPQEKGKILYEKTIEMEK